MKVPTTIQTTKCDTCGNQSRITAYYTCKACKKDICGKCAVTIPYHSYIMHQRIEDLDTFQICQKCEAKHQPLLQNFKTNTKNGIDYVDKLYDKYYDENDNFLTKFKENLDNIRETLIQKQDTLI